MNLFTDSEVATLSTEIDNQLRELENDPANEGISRAVRHRKKTVPSKQKQQLEQATGEKADSFLKKFARAAKKDLCQEGGVLYAESKKLGDLTNKSMLIIFGSILSGIGVPAVVLQTVVVTVSVIVIHIGIKAFCEECD